ncbi:MAG: selenocysteine-specific translation elongation factor [candidate division Zixibacteria bacterium]|nr:selenocysteine-specific translation elongation factor [candidate division Zixibacteria bacterium]
MIVVGTAGHIDHGKSAIVKRLTGVDPDRLPEEKARGMTIDLGFAFYETSDDQQIALIDVPGHERFVKNMIAGAGGIDAVLLVIAADDGWMPQSEEHFQITRLLGVTQGLVVINKIDLVEPDWVDLLEQDVIDKVAGSFLENAPILRVSAETGEGFEELATHLDSLPSRLASQRDIGKARLGIDRSFIRTGIGGVVTGTLRGGELKIGQTVGVWPGGVTGKVRTLQSNGHAVETAMPGQRTAISLTGVDRDRLVRGGVISARTDLDYFDDHPVLALSLEMLPNAPVAVSDRRRALLIVGTTEVEGELRLFDHKSVKPAETGTIFFRPDEQIYTLVGDHYILRLPTPMITLGGGTVLDHLERFPRRKQLIEMSYLKDRTTPGLQSLVLSELRKLILAHRENLLQHANVDAAEIETTVTNLMRDKKVGATGEYLFEVETLQARTETLLEKLKTALGEQSHLKGLTLDQLGRLLPALRPILPGLVSYLVEEKALVLRGDLYDLAGRGMSLKGVIKQVHDDILESLRHNKYDPPKLSQLASGGKIHQQAIKYVIDSGEGYKCGSDYLFLSEVWSEIIIFVREHLNQTERLTVPDLRERFGFTRKFAIPLLEELDRLKLTERSGDFRIKGKRFESEDFIS